MQPILVFIETSDGQLRKTSLEALSEAKRIGRNINVEVIALIIGDKIASFANELSSYGADKVLVAEGGDFKDYNTAKYTRALLTAVNKTNPTALFLSATPSGKDLSASISAELKLSALQDCISISYENGVFTVRRPVYAGKAIITVRALKTPAIITLRPKVFAVGVPENKNVSVGNLQVALTADDQRVGLKETVVTAQKKVELTEADIIVSGGRGMKAGENFKVIEELAQVLNAAVGASRAAVDSGWRPHTDQVGQTGKTVCPTLYIACGISGAIQHLAGMSSSKWIVAINKDPESPIFKVANYGVVGDLFEVVPALCQELKKPC
ncbi:MAG: electron transfer flavoprotein subunit alpha/FixB family protein [Planctomycetota bacterium]|nr:electron transfer flavoprotein subunit alpha/FixB family protein [Planctomycetota bacterium]MDI6787541.1 electron transfer flavoprotein subunit alpha/FixB family protein [Planctomycetota bacterium]